VCADADGFFFVIHLAGFQISGIKKPVSPFGDTGTTKQQEIVLLE